MLAIFLTTLHVVVCLILIAVVLLQSGKAADLAGAFGGMGSQTAFGPRGAATTLSRATTAAAIIFMITSLALSLVSTKKGRTANSVLDKSTTSSPAKPATPPATPPAAPTGKQ
jgi:preprotein translocase subunit SecG